MYRNPYRRVQLLGVFSVLLGISFIFVGAAFDNGFGGIGLLFLCPGMLAILSAGLDEHRDSIYN
jgi:hypothetical protein